MIGLWRGWIMGSSLAIYLSEEVARRGWNDSDLADRAGITRSNLSKIMDGRTKVPTLATLDRLARALDEPLSRLVAICGFTVGKNTDLTVDEQISILLETAPGFRLAVDKIAQLHPDDLQALQSYLDGALRRPRRTGRQ